MEGEDYAIERHYQGSVRCGGWIKKGKEKYTVVAKSRNGPSPPIIEISSFDIKTLYLHSKAEYVCEDGDPVSLAVHPSGSEFICSMKNSTKSFDFFMGESGMKIIPKEHSSLEGIVNQKCVQFSTDGMKLATAGEDGHLRIFQWPSLQIILDEPRAHKSLRDLDFSLDSEYLATTSMDGFGRVWRTSDGFPLTQLVRDGSDKIECCCFSRDGTKPFLFCTVQRGAKVVVVVWDISTWKKLGFKSLSKKPISRMSITLDGKFLALGSYDGDIGIVDVKKMELCQWCKKVSLGTPITTLDFSPTDRVILSASNEWDVTITKLETKEWKAWQLYLLMTGMFLASLLVYYILLEKSDQFWNFPLGRDQPGKAPIEAIIGHRPSLDDMEV